MRTNRRELLHGWNSIGSIDLGDGREAELVQLARRLARHCSVVLPTTTVTALAAAPGRAAGAAHAAGGGRHGHDRD